MVIPMSRRQFIESHGATCRNWNWSWSFVNINEKFVIFGAWDQYRDGNRSLIFSEKWQSNRRGRKKAGYKQSREHIRLVEEKGYRLKTFSMKQSDSIKDKNGGGSARIASFDRKLTNKTLKRVGQNWYASDDEMVIRLPEEVEKPEQYIEGVSSKVAVNRYERNRVARAKCIETHGYICAVCSIDFEEVYGPIGTHYIHVHHIVPLSKIKKGYRLDPVKDLIPVCPNCHAMIHITEPVLTVEQMRQHLARRRTTTYQVNQPDALL